MLDAQRPHEKCVKTFLWRAERTLELRIKGKDLHAEYNGEHKCRRLIGEWIFGGALGFQRALAALPAAPEALRRLASVAFLPRSVTTAVMSDLLPWRRIRAGWPTCSPRCSSSICLHGAEQNTGKKASMSFRRHQPSSQRSRKEGKGSRAELAFCTSISAFLLEIPLSCRLLGHRRQATRRRSVRFHPLNSLPTASGVKGYRKLRFGCDTSHSRFLPETDVGILFLGSLCRRTDSI